MSDRLSRFLAKLLRHDARQRGLEVSTDGYVEVEAILELPEANNSTEDDVRKIVERDRKGRFKVKTSIFNKLQIKATQGHSMQLSDEDLTPITHASDARVVLHGSRSHNWESIKTTGLSRKRRDHIHFAQGESGQTSGFPSYCDIAIEINLNKALRDGLKFYKSENDVILSPGNASGFIPKKYFKKAYNIRTRENFSLD
ncbi:tRNA 2'-phosphotransferase 1-like [Mizuhopecten yessoensis]|uniref:tRNA 2'-phosphotransferase 1-like n=1 Tax=Mizuhopecten yessoensis TaxID=6573 RepID=UPI000B45EADF|nr:tRNA 2'-phosphotransferase 1-like [Mizuhopecten yessoensis]